MAGGKYSAVSWAAEGAVGAVLCEAAAEAVGAASFAAGAAVALVVGLARKAANKYLQWDQKINFLVYN